MRRGLIRTVLAATIVVGLSPAAAQAQPLQGVDCDQLEQTVVTFFAVAPLTFENLGDLISTFQRDDELFAAAAEGFGDISELFGERIEFASMTQTVSTHSKCGLTPLVKELVSGG